MIEDLLSEQAKENLYVHNWGADSDLAPLASAPKAAQAGCTWTTPCSCWSI